MKVMAEWIHENEEINNNSKKTYQEEVNEQIQKVNEAMNLLKSQHSKEMNLLSQSYLTKINLLKEKEETALMQVESLKSELALYKEDLEKLKKINDKEEDIKKIVISTEDISSFQKNTSFDPQKDSTFIKMTEHEVKEKVISEKKPSPIAKGSGKKPATSEIPKSQKSTQKKGKPTHGTENKSATKK